MARKDDLEQVQRDIAAVTGEMQDAQRRYATYAAEVSNRITSILKGAGVYDVVNLLEVKRQETLKKAQEKMSSLQAKMQDLEKVRQYLEDLEAKKTPEKVEPNPEEAVAAAEATPAAPPADVPAAAADLPTPPEF